MYINHTETETWSVSDLVSALGDTPSKKKKILIPKFQRTLVWSRAQKKEFIDSIKRGFPVGALLLYKAGADESGNVRYNLIDGLQRSSTINQYLKEPTRFYDEANIADVGEHELQTIVRIVLDRRSETTEHIVLGEIIKWLHQRSGFEESDGFASFGLTNYLNAAFTLELQLSDVNQIVPSVVPFLERIRNYSDIKDFRLPVLVFSGDQNDLPLVFERLNSKGTQLSKYQIYAAAWQVYDLISIHNREVIDHVKKKYDSLIEEGYEIENYDSSAKFYTGKFSIFEYVFGLGKYLSEKYEYLFSGTRRPEQEDSIGFNVVNICLGLPFNKMDTLPKELAKRDVDALESAITESVDFVFNSLKGFVNLKMNKRQGIQIPHTELQIVSMIGKAFNVKYNADLSLAADASVKRQRLKSTLPYHYLYDVIREHWKGAGDTKAYELSTSERYENPPSKQNWENVLSEWFSNELEKREKLRPRLKDSSILFLKYLYTHSLTANEEISDSKFDLEHLVPVGRLREIAGDSGIPMSAISNLCLLDESLNRSKGDLTYYEFFDKQVAEGNLTREQADLELSKIEKFTLTTRENLAFVTNDLFEQRYLQFLSMRFAKLKELFFNYNQIADEGS